MPRRLERFTLTIPTFAMSAVTLDRLGETILLAFRPEPVPLALVLYTLLLISISITILFLTFDLKEVW